MRGDFTTESTEGTEMINRKEAKGAKGLRVRCNLVNPKDRRKVINIVRKLGLDRRKVYSVGYSGELATDEKATGGCSGCSCDCGDGYPCSHGCAGCEECGFTGKRVHHFPDPVRVGNGYVQIEPYHCAGCGDLLEHFDAGCAKCASSSGWLPFNSKPEEVMSNSET